MRKDWLAKARMYVSMKQAEKLRSSLWSVQSKVEHAQQSIGAHRKSAPPQSFQESNTISRVLSAAFYHEVIRLQVVTVIVVVAIGFSHVFNLRTLSDFFEQAEGELPENRKSVQACNRSQGRNLSKRTTADGSRTSL